MQSRYGYQASRNYHPPRIHQLHPRPRPGPARLRRSEILPPIEKYEPLLATGGNLIYNASLIVHPLVRGDINALAIPASLAALELGDGVCSISSCSARWSNAVGLVGRWTLSA